MLSVKSASDFYKTKHVNLPHYSAIAINFSTISCFQPVKLNIYIQNFPKLKLGDVP